MSRHTHVHIETPREVEGHQRVETIIETPSGESSRIWFKVPLSQAHELTDRADPFAVIALFTAMKAGHPVRIHGEVSPSLLRNLEEFQAVWAKWMPDTYQVVELRGDVERERPPAPDGGRVIAAFSGGVDAAYTALRHQRGLVGRRARHIDAAVMIQGYDMPPDEDTMFAAAFARSKVMTDSLGIPLIPVITNYRQVEPVWQDVHLAAVAASLMLFEGAYRTGLVGSSLPYDSLVFPWASSPVTDHLLGSDGFPIVHDGAEANRMEKLDFIAQWPEADENVLVCWSPTQDGGNCCRCNKCIRTILYYRVLERPRPACFAEDVSDEQIDAMVGLNDTMTKDFEILLRNARARGIEDSWVHALERRVRRFRTRQALSQNPVVQAVKTRMEETPTGRRMLQLVRKAS